jgi:hypothetical protein
MNFEALLVQLGRSLDQAEAARARDAEQLDALGHRIACLERQAAELDGKYTKILEERFKLAEPNTLTFEFQPHKDLADALKGLILAIDLVLCEIYYRDRKTSQTAVERADSLARFLRTLLPGTADPSRIYQDLAQHRLDKADRRRIDPLLEQALDLRRLATELDPTHVFDFEFAPGPVDSSRQRAWQHCDPEGEVRFVVSPAYVVGERVFLPQEVFTGPPLGEHRAEA